MINLCCNRTTLDHLEGTKWSRVKTEKICCHRVSGRFDEKDKQWPGVAFMQFKCSQSVVVVGLDLAALPFMIIYFFCKFPLSLCGLPCSVLHELASMPIPPIMSKIKY